MYFLSTKKLRDMNDAGFDHLEQLLDDVKIFRLDLSWLEPYVMWILGTRDYTRKALLVQESRDDLNAAISNVNCATNDVSTHDNLASSSSAAAHDLDANLLAAKNRVYALKRDIAREKVESARRNLHKAEQRLQEVSQEGVRIDLNTELAYKAVRSV